MKEVMRCSNRPDRRKTDQNRPKPTTSAARPRGRCSGEQVVERVVIGATRVERIEPVRPRGDQARVAFGRDGDTEAAGEDVEVLQVHRVVVVEVALREIARALAEVAGED